MSDEELVERLRDEHLAMTRNEAAAAIEALTAKLAKMVEERDTLRLVIEANIEKHRSRAEAAEAKLAKTVEALRVLLATAYADDHAGWQDALREARAIIAEIEGEQT
jgi:regulator of replication initiation timing